MYKEVKFTLEQVTKTQRGLDYSSTLSLTSALGGEWVVNATPRAALPPRKRPGTHCIGNLVGPMAGLDGCGKFRLPIGIRSAVGPARSESLYLLSYPGPHIPAYVSVKYA